MSIFDAISDFFSGGSSSSSTKSRSSGRGSGGNKTATQTVKSGVDQFKSDLTMGLSTFGMSKERQAEKLSEMGYSPGAIDSYQARTEATKQRNLSMMSSGSDDNDRPAPVVETAPTTTTATTTVPTQTQQETQITDIAEEVPPAPKPQVIYVGGGGGGAPAKPDPVYKGRRIAPPAGATEAEAMEAGAKGRKATIGTTPVGLLREPETKGRRSLMGLIK